MEDNPPYPAALEHPGVDQVRAHQRHLDAVLLRGLQLVAQRLVEPNGTELTGAVILRDDGERGREREREQVNPVKLCPGLRPGTTENISTHAPWAQRSLLAVNDTATKTQSEPVRRSTVSLAFFSCASGGCSARWGGFDVVGCGNNLSQKKRRAEQTQMHVNKHGEDKEMNCAHMTSEGCGSLK